TERTRTMKPFEDFFKSVASFAWAVPVFGLSQAGKVFKGLGTVDPTQLATESFKQTTGTIRAQFDAFDNTVFQTGEQAQHTIIDLAYSLLPLSQVPVREAPKPDAQPKQDIHIPTGPTPDRS